MSNKAEKVKKFFNEHRGEIAVGSAVVGMFALGYLHSKTSVKVPEVAVKAPELTPFEECSKKVDKDIFTNLAPTIEDAVLSEGIDGFYIDRDYPVEFESGDTRLRRVSVSVKDIGMYFVDNSQDLQRLY